MKKLILTLFVAVLLTSTATVAYCGLFCDAAKHFKWQSDVLNSFCAIELVWESGW